MGEKVQGIRSINGRYKIDGEVKNSTGNGEAKELTCTTHGHALRWGMLVGEGAVSYTHLTLPTIPFECRSRWSPYH